MLFDTADCEKTGSSSGMNFFFNDQFSKMPHIPRLDYLECAHTGTELHQTTKVRSKIICFNLRVLCHVPVLPCILKAKFLHPFIFNLVKKQLRDLLMHLLWTTDIYVSIDRLPGLWDIFKQPLPSFVRRSVIASGQK